MSDALDGLAGAAAPLLQRVDAVLGEAGAPDHDPLLPLLRRVGALPSEAVAAVAAWRPGPLELSEAPLRALAGRCGEVFDPLPRQVPWEGAGAEAYAVRWDSVRAHVLGPGADSVAGRLDQFAAYVGATSEWMTRSRIAVARAVADVLGSAEAVTLVTGLEPAGPAAARIAAHVLEPVAAACDEGERLCQQWHGRLSQLSYRPPAYGLTGGKGTLRIGD